MNRSHIPKTDAKERTYIAIDLKSFYASVECRERGLDPLVTNLVVADESRTDKTICLAVSPALKGYGVPGRPRLFEVRERVRQVNAERKRKVPGGQLTEQSWDDRVLRRDPYAAVDFLIAKPRMAYYMEYSTRVVEIYLRYIAPEDLHIYSIDEVFMDVTDYLPAYRITAKELCMRMIREVLFTTGITATAGIGSNLYLCKIAMDIVAKKMPPDVNGVRIAELNEQSYRRQLWAHRPITDFWRIGSGYAKKLEAHGMLTMGDVARCSVVSEDLLYKLFGVNAELLIDHAWGYEPCRIRDIKDYRPENNSLSSGQVLTEPYTFEKARLVTREMTDLLALDLVSKRLVADRITLTVGYDIENLRDPAIRADYHGEVVTDHYGRQIPKHSHGTAALPLPASSGKLLMDTVTEIYDRVVNPLLLIRRITIAVEHVVPETLQLEEPVQYDLFTDIGSAEEQKARTAELLDKEKHRQLAVLEIKDKYGKNAILRGMNLEEGATAVTRNGQIGGHKA